MNVQVAVLMLQQQLQFDINFYFSSGLWLLPVLMWTGEDQRKTGHAAFFFLADPAVG